MALTKALHRSTCNIILSLVAFAVIVLGSAKAFVSSPTMAAPRPRLSAASNGLSSSVDASELSSTGGTKTASVGSSTCHCAVANDDSADNNNDDNTDDNRRKTLQSLGLIPAVTLVGSEPALARQRLSFLVTTKNTTTGESVLKDPVNVETPSLSSELCLIRLLPVKNLIFKSLDGYIQSLSNLRSEALVDNKTWKECNRNMQSALSLIDSKRAKLEPLFIQDESTEIQIAKAERGERLIEALRTAIVRLQETTKAKNITATMPKQKDALLALADIGELLVPSFPFDVPNEGKFSFLPRLLGRCRVTFSFKRGNSLLGNVTIIADGFLAPITAGNFVDLSARQFYTGLAIKQIQKKLGGSPYFLPYQFRGIESL